MTKKTISHVEKLFDRFGYQDIFGRSDVESVSVTGLKSSRASVLLKELAEKSVIEPVRGHGKGKYKFDKKA